MGTILAAVWFKEMHAEYNATRKCLGRITENLYNYKPHPKSMSLATWHCW